MLLHPILGAKQQAWKLKCRLKNQTFVHDERRRRACSPCRILCTSGQVHRIEDLIAAQQSTAACPQPRLLPLPPPRAQQRLSEMRSDWSLKCGRNLGMAKALPSSTPSSSASSTAMWTATWPGESSPSSFCSSSLMPMAAAMAPRPKVPKFGSWLNSWAFHVARSAMPLPATNRLARTTPKLSGSVAHDVIAPAIPRMERT
mmetsp:Transcript_32152/g.106340  ORF Transcript_32152/g.106340 Transcript_32152/m.106340 type:complete len:201 (-) Transcript_32152:81-683(-)